MTRTLTALTTILTLTACATETPTPPAPAETQMTSPAITAEDIAAETARLNAFLEEQFNLEVSRSPMTQTFLGIKTDYDQWDDASDARAVEDFELLKAAYDTMTSEFDFEKLDDSAKLSYRLFEYEFKRAERAFPFRDHGYIFDQMNGEQSGIPAFLINQHQITSKSDAEAYIARLNGVNEYLGRHIENARNAAEKGIRPPAFVYDYVISDALNVITGYPFNENEGMTDSPLMDDFRKKIDALHEAGDISDDEHEALLDLAIEALVISVEPAYQDLVSYIDTDRMNATTEDGVWKLPNADAYYAMRLNLMTTTDLSASEIHDLGLAEMDRIHGEMREIMTKVGFEGTLQDFFEYTRTDDRFFKPNTEAGKAEYLAEATAMIDAMREELPDMFNTFPQAEMVVKAVEPFREKSAGKAFYQRPAPDGSRPGTYYANLYNTKDMPLYQMEALAYHEGIPGHHMQIAIAQELEGIPKFRKYGGYTAYTEGWGLYSEYFPKEFGFYEDPYSDFGRLAMELWRAARLVVDTGIHDKKWTREQAIDYLITNTPNPEGDCRKAIERYIVMPGQATAYKIGMMKIIELREWARGELGDAFDIRDYHDVVLKDGSVPLAMLEELVEEWVTETKDA
ncbi:MAG: DUF885 domain-containing protein [Ponticaulis sp.]|nr:DUF885 domain-containing protein [Ponticaulis sp.]|tara:strand:- start:3524 stop:5398 length:1875 start_codon:yes stop_codon:yes gene_type:complete